MKKYSFIGENCMCAAGVTSYSGPAVRGDVTYTEKFMKKKPKKKQKSNVKNPLA